MLHIRTFSPSHCADSPQSRRYHYHEPLHATPASVDVWRWFILHPQCGQVLLIDQNTIDGSTVDEASCPAQSATLADGKESKRRMEGKFGTFSCDKNAEIAVEDAEGTSWTIALETAEGGGEDVMLVCREYSLRPLSSKDRGRLVRVYSLRAGWDGECLPPIAEFKKQVRRERIITPNISCAD